MYRVILKTQILIITFELILSCHLFISKYNILLLIDVVIFLKISIKKIRLELVSLTVFI